MTRHARREHRLGADVGVLVLFVVACAIIAAAQVVEHLLPLVLLAGTGYGGWRLWRRHHTRARVTSSSPGRDRRVVPGSVVPGDQLAAVTAERDDLRLQVAKLEADAARHDALIEHLEAVTGRPVEAVIASYEYAQRIYRPAATGRTGGPR